MRGGALILRLNEGTWRYMQQMAEGRRRKFWDRMNAGSCWEAQGGRIQIFRQYACKKMFRGRGEHVDTEARWPQKISERKAGGIIRESKTSKQDARKKLLRDTGSLDIETKWRCMQKAVERPEGKSWDQINECRKLLQGTKGGSLDIESWWMRPKWGTITQAGTKLSPARNWKAGGSKKSRNW